MNEATARPGNSGGVVEDHPARAGLSPEPSDARALYQKVDCLLCLGLPLLAAAASAAIPAALRTPVPVYAGIGAISARSIGARKAHYLKLKRAALSQARLGSRKVSAPSELSEEGQNDNGLSKSRTYAETGGSRG